MNLTRWMFVVLATGTAAFAAPAPADTRSVACHGCTANQMRSSAAAASSGGTVYVFNQPAERVRKYFVHFDVDENARRYRVTKVAEETTVEADLQQAWEEFAEYIFSPPPAADPVRLPDDFVIRSVAGARLGEPSTWTSIERHLESLSFFEGAGLLASFVFAEMTDHSVPWVNGLVQDVRVVVIFPDGSSQAYTLEMQMTVGPNGGLSLSLEVVGTDEALTPDGDPLPLTSFQFQGITFEDQGGSLYDWMEWARRTGAAVVGVGGGKIPNCPTRMTCEVEGGQITCTVTGSQSC